MYNLIFLVLIAAFAYSSHSKYITLPFFRSSTQLTLFYHLLAILFFTGLYYFMFVYQTPATHFEGLEPRKDDSGSLLNKAIFFSTAIHCGTGYADIQPRGGFARMVNVTHILVALVLTLDLIADVLK